MEQTTPSMEIMRGTMQLFPDNTLQFIYKLQEVPHPPSPNEQRVKSAFKATTGKISHAKNVSDSFNITECKRDFPSEGIELWWTHCGGWCLMMPKVS